MPTNEIGNRNSMWSHKGRKDERKGEETTLMDLNVLANREGIATFVGV